MALPANAGLSETEMRHLPPEEAIPHFMHAIMMKKSKSGRFKISSGFSFAWRNNQPQSMKQAIKRKPVWCPQNYIRAMMISKLLNILGHFLSSLPLYRTTCPCIKIILMGWNSMWTFMCCIILTHCGLGQLRLRQQQYHSKCPIKLIS